MKKIFIAFAFAFITFFAFKNNTYAANYIEVGTYSLGNSNQRTLYVDVSDFPSDYYCLLRIPFAPNPIYKQFDLYYWDNSTSQFAIISSAPCYEIYLNGTRTNGYYQRPAGANLSPSLPVYDTLPTSIITVEDGLGYDITLSHTEFNYPLSSAYWEFVSVKGAWNYPNVRELTFDIYVNGEKRDTINKLNNFSTNFGVAFDFFTTYYNVVEGDTIRILCTPLGENVKGLSRGVEWVVGSKEDVIISKIPNITPKVDINHVPYTPTIQKERQFIYNPTTNEYVTNNYYTQNYESPDLSNIESQLDYIIQYLENNPTSSGGNNPHTIINNNITNKNYNFNFGDINFGDLDVDFEIGSAKEDVKNSFGDFISFLSILTLSDNLNKIVIALSVGIGTLLTVLAIVVVVKILDFFIPG